MLKSHSKNTVRYYLILLAFLSFLFFSNDFGLVDVQKTAIVMAAGIDREEDEFILTAQIAVPKASKKGNSSEAVQIVSKGKTVADALSEINAKTGWYPKLVFCKLVVLGESAAKQNVFDALDFFLRDEYLTDDCQLAVCENSAQELLSTSALIDPSSSVAISKVLSAHAERVGSAYPINLKNFAIGYFGSSKSGLLPVVKTQPQQEVPQKSPKNSGSSSEGGGDSSSQSSSEGEGQGSEEGKKSGESGGNKPVFSAQETALFVRGKWVERLTAEETFALNAATGKLRLANYSVETNGQTCTLSIKQNKPKVGLDIGRDGRGLVKIELTMVAGQADFSKAQDLAQTKDMGNPPDGAFFAAEKKLEGSLSSAYEKARRVGCDVLGLQERLIKYKHRRYHEHKDTLLSDTALSVKVTFTSVR